MTSRQEARERVRRGLRAWFLMPPRRHGEVVYTREVSFLELFYDLVYVVLIAQVAHHLATHGGWRGVWEFVVVFGLVWLAWFNGTAWHELHSREDGQARNYIFSQMMLLAVLAVSPKAPPATTAVRSPSRTRSSSRCSPGSGTWSTASTMPSTAQSPPPT